MKLSSILSLALLGGFLFASPAPIQDLGNFAGLAFSSATSRQDLYIQGGTLSNCAGNPSDGITNCNVQNGKVSVSGSLENALTIDISRVTIMNVADSDARVYYLKGTTELSFGSERISTTASVVLTVDAGFPNRVRGSILLPDQDARTSIEAYRAK